jgi:hypothetical protein
MRNGYGHFLLVSAVSGEGSNTAQRSMAAIILGKSSQTSDKARFSPHPCPAFATIEGIKALKSEAMRGKAEGGP